MQFRKDWVNFTDRLWVFLQSCFKFICFCCGKKPSNDGETRLIEVGTEDLNSKKKHNKIKTSKYTLLMFIPKNLLEQLRRVVNFYFLIVTIVAVNIDSPISPLTSIAPLVFVLLVTAVKQGYEDWLRHKIDKKVNNQIVEIVDKGVIKEVKNCSISPGTLVRVKRGREVPADLVVLCAAGERGKCYVTTANLDGETNLKALRVPAPLLGYSPDILPQHMRIEVPAPLADLYTFYGRLQIPGLDSLPLTPHHLMLRGSRLRNTDWAIGCAVYTGEETKLALNSKYTGNKFSSCERAINKFIAFFICLILVEITASVVAKILIESMNPERALYLGPIPIYPKSFLYLVQDLFSFMILYYYMVPISLYVTMEMYKFIGARYIEWDQELCDDETGRPAVANTSDLNEELGQVEVLFSDKTGTLTKNLMVFKSCSIKGRIYEERDSKLYEVNNFEEPVDTGQRDIKFFFKILAICHGVQISSEDMKRLSVKLSVTGNLQLLNFFRKKKVKAANDRTQSPTPSINTNTSRTEVDLDTILRSHGSKMDYQGSSPDEKALVEAADRMGVTFLGEEGNNLLLKVGEQTEIYERLQVIEFTSDRKRMSVIVRDKNGKIWLFCKGAESAVFPLCKSSPLIEDTDRDISMFANKGLRTLAIAFRQIPEDEYIAISETIRCMDSRRTSTLQNMTQQYNTLEQQLTLVGATGVEDCLQDDVSDTLAVLRRAGISVWVLTGDKVETAISVSQSCAHISENDRRMMLVEVYNEVEIKEKLTEFSRIVNEPTYKDLTLVVDGASMSMVLDSAHAAQFAETALRCSAVLCCRLSPLQKAKIVRLIKGSARRPVTAAIGDGANDISMIQEAHVGFGIFGKEGHQAARSADFAFTKFSMVRKMLLVMGHWYYQRLATFVQYFLYKNVVLCNIMLAFQFHSAFSTQSIYDSMYLTIYNFLTTIPCLILSVSEQRWPKDVLLRNPILYRNISRNNLLTWSYFGAWCMSACFHSAVIYGFTVLTFKYSVIFWENVADLWSFGAVMFHLTMVIVNLKLWLHTRYNTFPFVISVFLSILIYMALNAGYSMIYIQFDGDVLGTYTRLLQAPAFWFLNILAVIGGMWPDYIARMFCDKRDIRQLSGGRVAFFERFAFTTPV